MTAASGGGGMSNALAELRRRREAAGGSAPEEEGAGGADGTPGFAPAAEVGADADPERGALRRIIARLSAEGQGLSEEEQRALVKALVAAEAGDLPRAQVEAVEREVMQSLGGRLGLLQPLLDDPGVTEIMVNRPDQVFVERDGRIERTEVRFRDDRSVQALVERIVGPLGRSFSVAHPLVDARLPDGSRLNAVRPPVSLLGTTVTIRRFPRALSLRDLVEAGAFGAGLRWAEPAEGGAYPAESPAWVVLAWAVRHRVNLVVSGGTGSGKTTMLNALSEYIPRGERVVFVEDAAELRPRLPHVVRLEARPPNAEGSGAVTIQHLVVNALRMRPDRIVVGEVRDLEALDMLVAMNTGHDGSLTTVHANSAREVFHRLVQATTLRSAGGVAGNRDVVVSIAASAIGLIVQMVRDGGSRRVDAVVAVEGTDAATEPRLRVLYRWEAGRMVGTGEVPVWAEGAPGRGSAG
jgi:pilus assembly protein CpaF